jgi:serine/threonine protein kinase
MLCPTCGTQNPDYATICSSCGASLATATGGDASGVDATGSEPTTGDAVPLSPALRPGTKLQAGAFTVGPVLGQGGFGITYKGADMQLRRYVAIKEFFPPGSERSGQTVQPAGGTTPDDYQSVKAKFIEEARALARFNHPGIVRVFSTFEENNTAYMVMEFLEGQTLEQILQERGSLPESEAVEIIEKVGDALGVVHSANLIHRDIKPDNILITGDGRAVLLDFGTARAFAMGKTVRQTALLTPGYAPLEQYGEHARFGVYSDIYALGATLYRCLTGTLPPQATDRAVGVQLTPPDQVNPYITREVSDAVMWALQLKADQRPQSMQDFLNALRGQAPAQSPSTAANTAPGNAAPTVFADSNSAWRITSPPDSEPSPPSQPQPAPRLSPLQPTVVQPQDQLQDAASYNQASPTQQVAPPAWQQPPAQPTQQWPQAQPPQAYPPQYPPPSGQQPAAWPPPPTGQPQWPPIPPPQGYPPNYPPPYQPQRYVEKKGGTILALAIIGLFCCGILAPISWVMANSALAEYGDYDPGDRGTVQAGRIIGIIGTVWMGLWILFCIVSAMGAAGSSGIH